MEKYNLCGTCGREVNAKREQCPHCQGYLNDNCVPIYNTGVDDNLEYEYETDN